MQRPIYLFALLVLGSLWSCSEGVSTDETAISAEGRFSEPHRPHYHFTPPSQWMNDPNGMIYYEGEYHLFYQHYPDSNVWGPMHWGHAVSPDLVHWEHLPIGLYPDSLGYIFSGSAVVDRNNTSGFGTVENPPLIAIFTYHDPEGAKAGRDDFQFQAIAYSLDRGRNWTKYAGNPVVPNPGIRDFRDPKVFWHEPSQQWVMIFAARDRVRLYHSPNLKDWTYASEFGAEAGSHGGVWECPDLFELPVEGTDDSRWVMLLSINPGGPNGGSATQYFVGDFDGQAFTLDHSQSPRDTLWLDYGRDNYAGVTWSDIPETDGGRLFIGWMSNWDYATVVPTTAWRSAMTLPRTLSLARIGEHYRVRSRPVQELDRLRKTSVEVEPISVSGTVDLMDRLDFSTAVLEAELIFTLPETGAADLGVELSNDLGERYRIGYNGATNRFYSDRTQAGKTGFSDKFAAGRHLAPRLLDDRALMLHLYLDVASAEAFFDGGSVVLTDIFFPNADFNHIRLYAEGGAVQLETGTLHQLQGIWE